jgi:hypothetical protein
MGLVSHNSIGLGRDDLNLRMLIATSTALFALLSGSAFADDALTTSSEQAVIIFTKSCMTFASQKDQLRSWAEAYSMNLDNSLPSTGK